MNKLENFANKRKRYLVEYRKMLIERLELNKRIRQVQKDMTALDSYLLQSEG